jgi:hypothetical protein
MQDSTRDLLTVTRLHGADVATYIADTYPAALPLIADGWTTDSALQHIAGDCDKTICTGEHCSACEVRPAGHGHFALFCEPCSVLPYGQHA